MGSRMRSGAFLYKVLWPVAWLLTHLVCRYQIYGREHVPVTGSLLIVANHLSWYDPILFSVLLPRRLWFFAKIEAFSWPVIGWLCRGTGQIPVQRGEGDRAALEKALAYLQEGRAVVIFPEGTVERQEHMIAARPGVAMLALRSGVPILPLAHVGTRRVFCAQGGFLPRVLVKIGEPYIPKVVEGSARKITLQNVTYELMRKIALMLPPERRGVYAD